MKYASIVFALCSAAVVLNGCAVYTPNAAVVVDPRGVVVPAGQGHHCPPGQAKKGNC
jgi:hypothetical protein